MLAPGASGVGTVIDPADRLPFIPPPIGCVGGCSNVVPCTVIVQGVVGEPFAAKHVAGSLMPLTITEEDVIARTSAIPGGTGAELISTMRKRNRVIGAPVLLTNRRLTDSVPLAPFGTGVKSRPRLGVPPAGAVESMSAVPSEFSSRGEARFSGPGAPNLWPAGVFVASVSAKRKSVKLLFLSTGNWVLQPPKISGLPPLPHGSRWKLYSSVLPPTGGRLEPSRNKSQKPPVLLPNPTPSRAVRVERFTTLVVLKIPTLASDSMSALNTESPAAAPVPP